MKSPKDALAEVRNILQEIKRVSDPPSPGKMLSFCHRKADDALQILDSIEVVGNGKRK